MRWQLQQIAIALVISFFGLSAKTLCADAGVQAAKGRLAGRVLAPDGSPVTGAQVMYDRVREFRQSADGLRIYELNPELRTSGIVVTRQDGSFVTPDIPEGDYGICVEAPGSGLLDSCKWSPVVKSAVPQDRPVEIRLALGGEVRASIEDPTGFTPTYNGLREIPKVVVGAQTETGAFHALRIAGRDNDGWALALTVPFDMALKLWVYSPEVELVDEVGTRVAADRGVHVPFQVTRAAASREFLLTATGRVSQ